MARSIVVAQATGAQAPTPAPTQIVTVVKPGDNQAITIHLDGSTKLDLSAIANENITLVHVGDRLIILFANHAQVTVEPFYADNGQPLPNLTVELGPGRDITGAEFAQQFPVTTDQSVLPASGGPNAISSGANFASFTLDTFTTPTPLALLGPETFAGPNGPNGNGTPQQLVSITLDNAVASGTVFEAGIVTDGINTTGNNHNLAVTATGVTGSLDALVNFGTGGPNATPFQFVSQTAANTWLTNLGITSNGAAVDTATITGNTLVASTDAAAGTPHTVFTLTINADGSWTFTLLAPLDDAAGQGHNSIDVDLSGLVLAVDAAGLTLPLSKDLIITVVDDVPQLTEALELRGAQEGALSSGTVGDLFGTGNDHNEGASTVVSGSLSALVSFGADGPETVTVTNGEQGTRVEADGFQFSVASNTIHDFNVTSHGQEVNFVTLSTTSDGEHGVSQTLTAWTNGGPGGENNAHEVFTLTLNGDGTYTFTLLNPIDNGPNQDERSAALDLSTLIQAIDFDGDVVGLSGDFTITVSNDTPTLNDATDTSHGVDEGALASGNGLGGESATTIVSGSLASLVSFGADGAAETKSGAADGFQFAVKDGSAVNFGDSHGQPVNFVTIAPSDDGTAQILTAWTNGGPGAENSSHAVFTLELASDGSYTFTLLAPLDETSGGRDTTTLDLSSLIQAVDFDGDTVALSGDFTITVTDDIPVTTSATDTSHGVDEGALLGGNGLGGESASTIVSGSLASLVSFGADGAAETKAGATDGFQLAVKDGSAVDFGNSHGQPVNFVTVTTSDDGTSQTLTAWTNGGPGEGHDAHEVFTLELNGDGKYTFTLIAPLDESSDGRDTTTLDLSTLIKAVDFDGDTVALSGDFKITVTDDVPVLAASAEPVTGSVDEGGLTSTDTHGIGNDPGFPTSTGSVSNSDGSGTETFGSLAPLISFGADGASGDGSTAFRIVGTDAATAWLSELGLTSHGNSLQVASDDGHTLTVSDGSNTVFTLTVNGDGSWVFNLLEPLDHVPGGGENAQNVDLSGFVEALDFDQDPVGLSTGTVSSASAFNVTVVDDVPVTQGNLVQNGDFTAGNFDPHQFNGFTFGIAFPGDPQLGWTVSASDVHGATQVELERVPSGYDPFNDGGVYMPDGHFLVDMEASPGDIKISQVVHNVVDGQQYSLEFFAGAGLPLTPGSDELLVFWGNQQVADIIPGSTPTPYLVEVTGGANDAANTLTFEEVGASGDFIGTYLGDVLLEAGTPLGIVDEGGLASGSVGDQFGTGNDAKAATIAGGTLAGLVSFGADGPAAVDPASTGSTGGFQLVDKSSAQGLIAGLGLTSHDQAVDVVDVTIKNGVATLTASTSGEPGHDVFTLTLDESTGAWTFTLINPIDNPHLPAGVGEDSVILDLTGLVQAVDFDGDIVPLQAGSFKVDVIDDVPVATGATDVSGSVDEGALLGGNGLGGESASTIVTGSLASLVSFGADGAAETKAGTADGFQLAVKDGSAVDFGNSHGQPVNFVTVTTSDDGTSQTLTAWTDGGPGEGHDSHAVFTLELSGDGQYTFTLLTPLDELSGGRDTTTLDLSSLIQAVDFDGDAVALSGDFTVTVIDDVTVISGTQSGSVNEGGLTHASDPYGTGNDAGAPTAATGSLGIHFGADGQAASSALVFTHQDAAANVSFTDAEGGTTLTSHGQTVQFELLDGGTTLVGYTGGAPTSASDTNVVFSVSLSTASPDGSFDFVLRQPLDQASPGTDSLNLTFDFTAKDFDGDTAHGTFTVSDIDDVPVTQFPVNSAENLIENGNFALGAFTPQSYGGFATPGNVPGWTLEPSDVGPATQVQLERVFDGYLGVTMPDGDQMVDLEATPGNIAVSQAVAGVVAGETYALEFFAGASNPGSSELEVFWDGQQIADIHPTGTETPYVFTVVGDSGTNLLTFEEVGPSGDNTGTYLADVSLWGSAGAPVGIVDEGGLTSGTIGDRFGSGNDHGATSASGSLASIVSFGADGPAAVNTNAAVASGGFQIDAANAQSLISGLGLKSHGDAVDHVDVTFANGVATLTASTSGQSGHEVFQLTLDEGTGAWTFTLVNPLDDPAAGKDALLLDLSGLVKAVDFDGDAAALQSGSFLIDVLDDVPVPASGAAELTGLVNEGGLTNGNESGSATTFTGAVGSLDTLISFGADGQNTTPFQFVSNAATMIGDLNLTSHGVGVDFATVTGTTLAAFTGTQAGGAEVFTLTLNADGSWTFHLLAPIDHNGAETIDLSKFVQAVDFDGDTVTLAANQFTVQVLDDVPVTTTGTTNLVVDEGGLTSASDTHGVGNDGGIITTSGDLALDNLVKFGADGAGTPAFQLVGTEAAQTFLNTLGLTSHGESLEAAVANGELTVSDADGHSVFTLTLAADGSYTFNLLEPLDHPPGGGTLSLTFDLSGFVQAVDFDGSAVTLAANQFTAQVQDDVPVQIASATPVSGSVDEGGLTSAHDSYGSGNDQGFAVSFTGASGSLSGLVDFGADGPGATSFQLVDQGAAGQWLSGLGLTSHGFKVNSADVNGSTLTANDSNGDHVFTLTVNGDGSWTFTLLEPLDQATGNGENATIIDLSGLVQAVDFDGDAITLADVGAQVTTSVALSPGQPVDILQAGQLTFEGLDFGGTAVTSFTTDKVNVSGQGLGIGNASIGDNQGFMISRPGTDAVSFDLFKVGGGTTSVTVQWAAYDSAGTPTSSSTPVATGTLTVNVDKNGDPVVIDPPGTFDHLVVQFDIPGNDKITANDFSYTASDGAPVFSVNVVDDVPVISGTMSGSIDEGALTSASDPYGTGNDIHGASASLTSTGTLGIHFGADGQAASGAVVFTNASVSFTGAEGGALTSHGQALEFTLLNGGTTLVAYTGATAPQSIDGTNVVFSVTLSAADGSYDFVLKQPLDQAASGTDGLNLTFNFTAKDFDGDTASGTFTVTDVDDVPVISGTVSGTVEEGALANGNDPQGVTSITQSLGIHFGADGPANAAIPASSGTAQTFNFDQPDPAVESATLSNVTVTWNNGTDFVSFNGTGDQAGGTMVTVASTNGTPFTFGSVDLGLFTGAQSGHITVTGIDINGKTITDSVLVSGITATSFEAPSLFSATGSPFDGVFLKSLTFTLGSDSLNAQIEFDNLKVNTGGSPATTGPLYFSDLTSAVNNISVTDNNVSVNAASLKSQGQDIHYALLNSETLVAYTGTTPPGTANAPSVVFSVTLSADAPNGSYNFVLDKPIDELNAGADNLAFTFKFTAQDFDGDTQSGTFTVTDVDDLPVLASSPTGLVGTVNEGGLTSGNESGSATAFTGTTGSLDGLVHFGADGQNTTPFQFVSNAAAMIGSLGLSSHGVGVDFATVSASGTTLTAFTGSQAGGTEVFTLTLNADGSWTFHLTAPIDHLGSEMIDLSKFVQAVDFDGDAVALVSGDLQVTITDDAPVLASGATGLSATVNEGGLTNGNEPSSATSATGGSLDSVVHFGADGQNATPFQFVSNAAAMIGDLGLTSHSVGIDFATVAGTTLTAFTGTQAGGTEVFTLTLNPDGTWTFHLTAQIDHNGAETIDLSKFVEAVDFDNSAVTLASGDLTVTIIDDAPVLASGATGLSATVNEGGLTNGNESGSATSATGGSLDGLVHFGADGQNAAPFQLVANAAAMIGDLGLTSHDVAVGFATVNGTTLTAFTGTQAGGTEVFTLTLNADGTWTFHLTAQIDHNGAETIDLSKFVEAVDFDGSTVTLASGDLQVTITDDAPVLASGATGLSATVNEGGLANGNESSSATSTTGGSLDSLVHFGADGQNAAPFQFVANAAAMVGGLNLSSHGVGVDFATVTGTTLAAFTGTQAGGTEVFTLTLNADGTWTFSLLAPIDHLGSDTIDLSKLVEAVDFDGSTATLASGDLNITITDDTPVVSGTVSSSVDEGALTSPTDPYGTGNDIHGASASLTAMGSLGVHFGADGQAASGALAFTNANVSFTGAEGGALTSHGLAVQTTLINGTLVAYTGTTPQSTDATNVVFTVSLSATDGTYDFVLKQPLDQAASGTDGLNLTFNFTAQDFDGSTASSTFTVTDIDDVPVISGSVAGSVDEGGLANGNDANAVTSATGSLGINFGADGPAPAATIGPVFFSDQTHAQNNVTVHDASGALVTGLTSHGQTVSYALINSDTLVGYTGATAPTTIHNFERGVLGHAVDLRERLLQLRPRQADRPRRRRRGQLHLHVQLHGPGLRRRYVERHLHGHRQGRRAGHGRQRDHEPRGRRRRAHRRDRHARRRQRWRSHRGLRFALARQPGEVRRRWRRHAGVPTRRHRRGADLPQYARPHVARRDAHGGRAGRHAHGKRRSGPPGIHPDGRDRRHGDVQPARATRPSAGRRHALAHLRSVGLRAGGRLRRRRRHARGQSAHDPGPGRRSGADRIGDPRLGFGR